FSVVALQAHNYGHFYTNLFHGTNHAFGDHVAAHYAAEDIDEYRFNRIVGENNFKGFNHTLFGRTAAHVEEVGRLAAVQLNDIHGAHGQASTVDHAADVAIECHIVQLPGSRVSFARIFL